MDDKFANLTSLYTLRQVAEKSGKSYTWIMSCIKRKKLNAVLHGGRHLVAKEEYERWIASSLKPGRPLKNLTIAKAADKAGVSVQTIRNNIKNGKLSSIKKNNRIEIAPEMLTQWQESRENRNAKANKGKNVHSKNSPAGSTTTRKTILRKKFLTGKVMFKYFCAEREKGKTPSEIATELGKDKYWRTASEQIRNSNNQVIVNALASGKIGNLDTAYLFVRMAKENERANEIITAFIEENTRIAPISVMRLKRELEKWRLIGNPALLGFDQVIQDIRNGKADVNESDEYYTHLGWAIAYDSIFYAKKLLKLKADPNKPGAGGDVPLFACSTYEQVKTLASAGADVNYKNPATGQTPLYFATLYGRPDVIKALVDSGADMYEQCTPKESGVKASIVHTAAFAALSANEPRKIEVLKSYKKCGYDLAGVDGDGSLLHACIILRDQNTLEWLAKQKINKKIRNMRLRTPLEQVEYLYETNEWFILGYTVDYYKKLRLLLK